MPQVPVVRTTLSQVDAKQFLAEALRERAVSHPTQADDTPEVLALLLALWDLETNTGRDQFGFNFGNQIATVFDGPNAQDFFIADDSGNQRKFRSYPNFQTGAKSFVSQVTSTTRPQWAAGLRTGDPVEFTRALKGLNGGPAYYEASLERYQRGFLQRWERYRADRVTLPDAAAPSDGAVGAGLLGGAFVSALVLWAITRKR